MSTPSPDWRFRAACAGMDGDLFFPEWDSRARPAQAVCAACPVQRECLEYALEHNICFGVWGGLTEHERQHGGPRLCRGKRHVMDEANARVDRNGHEKCRACRAEGQRRYEEARRAS